MVLIGVIPENFAYGLLATIFTHSIFVAPALTHFVFYGVTFYAVHRCDVDEGFGTMPPVPAEQLLLDGLPLQVAATWLGVFVGAAFVYAFNWPRLLTLELFYSLSARSERLHGALVDVSARDSDDNGGGDEASPSRQLLAVGTAVPWNARASCQTFLLVLIGMTASVAIYFWELRFTEGCVREGEPDTPEAQLDVNTQRWVAALLTAFAVVALFIYVYGLFRERDSALVRVPQGHERSQSLNFKYFLYMSVAAALPAIYDFVSWTPFARWALQSVAFALVLVLMLVTGTNTNRSLGYDRYLGVAPRSRVAFALFVWWLVYTTVYLSAPLTDTGTLLFVNDATTAPSVVESLKWTAFISAIWIVILVFGGLFYHNSAWQVISNKLVDRNINLWRARRPATTPLSAARSGAAAAAAAAHDGSFVLRNIAPEGQYDAAHDTELQLQQDDLRSRTRARNANFFRASAATGYSLRSRNVVANL